ncbi:MAG TPA: Dabb family protein [Pyrinomonadaceae bacterium]|nr:Dabb family protein [Pyrinomonadaceae bacterium]
MLTHIVMWKYRGDTSQDTRDDHVAQLRSLSSVVPGIQSFSVGVDVLHSARSYDTGLVATFRDRAVLEAYSDHPDHVKIVEFSRGICETMAKVDFED